MHVIAQEVAREAAGSRRDFFRRRPALEQRRVRFPRKIQLRLMDALQNRAGHRQLEGRFCRESRDPGGISPNSGPDPYAGQMRKLAAQRSPGDWGGRLRAPEAGPCLASRLGTPGHNSHRESRRGWSSQRSMAHIRIGANRRSASIPKRPARPCRPTFGRLRRSPALCGCCI